MIDLRQAALKKLADLGQEIEQEKRGSIALARQLCYEIAGATSEDDMDGGGYGSVDIAEILSAEVVRLQAALAQPEQQAEPVQEQKYEKRIAPYSTTLSMLLNTTPPQQQAEPPPEWPLIKNILDEYGLDAIAFVAAWKAAQRPWQSLTPDEVKHLYPYGRSVWGRETFEAIEKALKEKNT